ncbi:AraC family transcriptional regulator [Nocardioides ferulae]|uniref:AraC family transcriptional regulator n=1 Tax=Nocardioides ferulae TaxID=2340821 RepID=UPI0013DDD18D|nr:helix-turn-helix domain-containing protein [Nocardioides ferulae]
MHGVTRTLPASTLVPVVISWGDHQHVTETLGGIGTGLHGSFAAGLRPGPTRTRFRGEQGSVQVYLTPLGATRILGVPGRELANRVCSLGDVAPSLARLSSRLAETSTWSARLALVDRALLALADSSSDVDATVQGMWRSLAGSHGTTRIDEVLTGTSLSARAAAARFVAEIGLPPKATARMLRFEHAARAIGTGRAIADVAASTGYADQSHLTREFRALAGITPGRWAVAPPPSAQTALGSRGP